MTKYLIEHEGLGAIMRSAFALRLKGTVDELFEVTKGVKNIDKEKYVELMVSIGDTVVDAMEFEELMEDN